MASDQAVPEDLVADSASSAASGDDFVPQINPTLKRKVQKLVDTNINDEELITSLRDLSTVYDRNTLTARWHLRDRLERRVLVSTDNVLEAFTAVDQLLEELRKDIDSISSSCKNMDARLSETEKLSGKLIQQAEGLFVAEKDRKIKFEVSQAFLERFQLSPEEQKAIKSPDIDETMFQALKRAQLIQSDCKALLRLPNTQIGNQILNLMGEYIETAYRKLYKWVREEIQRTFEQETPEVSRLIVFAFEALQDRAVLMNSCLEELGMLRNRVLVRLFIDALTQGGPNGVPRPIEIHAHDPRRYVGDMAAWLHQALASEHELASSVLRQLRKENQEDKKLFTDAVEQILTESFKDVCRPFRVRVDQVLSSPLMNAITAFFLSNTFFFYSMRFADLGGHNSPLVLLCDQCRHDAKTSFQSLFAAMAEKAKQTPSSSAIQELSPSREMLELIQAVREVTSICENSLLSEEERVVEFGSLFEKIAQLYVDVTRSNASVFKLTRFEEAVYSANCLQPCAFALSSAGSYANAGRSILQSKQNINIENIVQEQVAALLRACGMAPKLATVIHYQSLSSPQQQLSSIPGMEQATVHSTFRAFENSLLDLGTFTLPLLAKLESAELRASSRAAVAKTVAEAYSTFYFAVLDPKSGYTQPEAMARYKPDQVAGMIDI